MLQADMVANAESLASSASNGAVTQIQEEIAQLQADLVAAQAPQRLFLLFLSPGCAIPRTSQSRLLDAGPHPADGGCREVLREGRLEAGAGTCSLSFVPVI